MELKIIMTEQKYTFTKFSSNPFYEEITDRLIQLADIQEGGRRSHVLVVGEHHYDAGLEHKEKPVSPIVGVGQGHHPPKGKAGEGLLDGHLRQRRRGRGRDCGLRRRRCRGRG